jgi:hypothetical protein
MIPRIKAWLTHYHYRRRVRRLRRQWRASALAPRLQLLPLHLLLLLQLHFLVDLGAERNAKTDSFLDRLRQLRLIGKKTACERGNSAIPKDLSASPPPCLAPWQVNLLRRLVLFLLIQACKALNLCLGMRRCWRRYSNRSCRPSRT